MEGSGNIQYSADIREDSDPMVPEQGVRVFARIDCLFKPTIDERRQITQKKVLLLLLRHC